jgi:polar amino acid transport system substrate-binding protein
VIATEARYAPFEMLEDGKIVGLGKDILTEVMKGLPGVKVVQLDIPFQGFYPVWKANDLTLWQPL